MLQGERDLATVSNLILSELAPLVNAQHGVFYTVEKRRRRAGARTGGLATPSRSASTCEPLPAPARACRQCAYEKKRILLTNVPDDYIQISSGLGEAPPLNIIVLPVLFEEEVKAVIELASFNRFSETHQSFLDQLTESIGIVLNTIAANMRTEDLLKQSQLLTDRAAEPAGRAEEDQRPAGAAGRDAAAVGGAAAQQQDELQQTNDELEEKARLLEIQKREVEAKNREVARRQDGAGGEGRAAGADLAVQVRSSWPT